MTPRGARRRYRRHHHLRIRTTYEGRRLLPQELPIISAERMAELREDEMAAVRAVCEDMLSTPTPPTAEAAGEAWASDRWPRAERTLSHAGEEQTASSRSSGDVVDVFGALSEKGETLQAATEQAVTEEEGWGEANAIIEEWFRTGEFGLHAIEEIEPETTWLGSILRRVRRMLPGMRTREAVGADAA